jgi:uncharacterized protein YkwD
MLLRLTTTVSMTVTLAAVLRVAAAKPGKTAAADILTVGGCTGRGVALTAAERRMPDLHNQKRASQKLSKLCLHPALQSAVRPRCREMSDKDYLSHDFHGGR